MFRAGGLVSSVLICGLSASEAICQIEQQEQSRSPISVDMRRAKPLGWQEEQALRPLDMFKECEVCPEMIVVPAGGFMRGAPKTEDGSEDNERPEHMVTIAKPFSVGGFAVTFEEWDACVADGGCRRYRPGDRGWGRGRRPVINLGWGDATVYTKWLSEKTGRDYRLLSEAEREYVTRAGTNTPFWWGVSISSQHANYDGGFTMERPPTALRGQRETVIAVCSAEVPIILLRGICGRQPAAKSPPPPRTLLSREFALRDPSPQKSRDYHRPVIAL